MDPRWMRETPTDPLLQMEVIDDHRRDARTAAELPCKIVSHYWEHPVAHHITEMSSVGVWVDTLFPLHAGAEVVVCFTPPGADREFRMFAHVARVVTGRRRKDRGPLGMALAFSDVTPSERDVLATAA